MSGELGEPKALKMIVSKNRSRWFPDARSQTERAERTYVVSRILTGRRARIVSTFGESEGYRLRFAGGRAGGHGLGGTGLTDHSFRDGHKHLDHQNPEDGSPDYRSSGHLGNSNVSLLGRSTEIHF